MTISLLSTAYLLGILTTLTEIMAFRSPTTVWPLKRSTGKRL